MLAIYVFNWLQKSEVPEDWNNAMVVLHYKEGEQKKHRIRRKLPSYLHSVIYKIFTKALTSGFESVLDLTPPREQFQSEFSTKYHIQAVWNLIEKHKKYNIPPGL